MKSNMKVHLKIDPVHTITEVNINTYDKNIGGNLLDYINKFSLLNTNKLSIKTSEGIFIINKSDIMFAEIFDKKLTITTTEGEFTTRMTLNKLHQELTFSFFIQISKSSIINMNFIKKS